MKIIEVNDEDCKDLPENCLAHQQGKCKKKHKEFC